MTNSLLWLYDQIHIHGAHMPVLDGFLKTDASHLGVPFTAVDLNKASEWLAQNGYIWGIGVQDRAVLRCTIESKGSAVVERGGSVMDDKAQGEATFNIMVHGGQPKPQCHSGY